MSDAQQGHGADCLQRALRSRFRQRLMPGVSQTSGSNMKIRHGTEGDAEALRRFVSAVWSEGLPTLFEHATMPTLEEERQFLAACLRRPNSTIFLSEEDGAIVGMLDFQGHSRPQMQHGGILAMSVARTHRRRGIGRALLSELILWAPSHAVSRLELEVFATNVGAIRLYEEAGFRQEGCRRGAVLIDGNLVDMLLMARHVAG